MPLLRRAPADPRPRSAQPGEFAARVDRVTGARALTTLYANRVAFRTREVGGGQEFVTAAADKEALCAALGVALPRAYLVVLVSKADHVPSVHQPAARGVDEAAVTAAAERRLVRQVVTTDHNALAVGEAWKAFDARAPDREGMAASQAETADALADTYAVVVIDVETLTCVYPRHLTVADRLAARPVPLTP